MSVLIIYTKQKNHSKVIILMVRNHDSRQKNEEYRKLVQNDFIRTPDEFTPKNNPNNKRNP